MAGAADRCVIPEHPFDIEHLAELLIDDRNRNPSRYAVVAGVRGRPHAARRRRCPSRARRRTSTATASSGGIGDKVAAALKELSPQYNNGRRINVVNQRLGYLVRSGDPDALDSIVPMAFGNLALDLVLGSATAAW